MPNVDAPQGFFGTSRKGKTGHGWKGPLGNGVRQTGNSDMKDDARGGGWAGWADRALQVTGMGGRHFYNESQ